jgi:hypothetical protein
MLGSEIIKQNRIERLNQVLFKKNIDRLDPSGQCAGAERGGCGRVLGQDHLAIQEPKTDKEKQNLETTHGGLAKHPINRFEKHFPRGHYLKIKLKTTELL